MIFKGIGVLIKGGSVLNKETHAHTHKHACIQIDAGSYLWLWAVAGSQSCLRIRAFPSQQQQHLLYKHVHPPALIPIMIIWMFKQTHSVKEGENCSIKWQALRKIMGNFTSSDWNNGFVKLDRMSSTFQPGMRLLPRQSEGTGGVETVWRAMKETSLTVSMLRMVELIRGGVWWVIIAG